MYGLLVRLVLPFCVSYILVCSVAFLKLLQEFLVKVQYLSGDYYLQCF